MWDERTLCSEMEMFLAEIHTQVVHRKAIFGVVTFYSLGQGIFRAGLKALARLRECCRQAQAEVVSNSKNKIHQTWGLPLA